MKIFKNKLITAVVAIAALCLFPTTSAFAVTPMYGHKYVNGVGSVAVWLDYGSGVGYWSSYITNAANNWMYPGSGMSNPIYMNFVSSNYGSNMDFYLRYNDFWGEPGVLAETKFYVNGPTQVNQWTTNWNFTNIYINHDSYSLPQITNDQALGTTIHEMGHAFGLDHYNTNSYSIMAQLGPGNRIVQRVQPTDNDSVNIIY